MPILNCEDIRNYIQEKNLIHDPLLKPDGRPSIEAASYDLRAGIVVWKDRTTQKLETLYFKEGEEHPPSLTLAPGQMVFVITHEELELPSEVSGTVYSRNRLQKENILALNAGHVDPGYHGPIIIRLINLGAQGWPLELGDPVFTVVFHTVTPPKDARPPDRRTKETTLDTARRAASNGFSNPFHDLYKDEIDRQLNQHYTRVLTDLRHALDQDYFSRKDIHKLLIQFGAAILAFVFVIARMPWDKVWHGIKWILHL